MILVAYMLSLFSSTSSLPSCRSRILYPLWAWLTWISLSACIHSHAPAENDTSAPCHAAQNATIACLGAVKFTMQWAIHQTPRTTLAAPDRHSLSVQTGCALSASELWTHCGPNKRRLCHMEPMWCEASRDWQAHLNAEAVQDMAEGMSISRASSRLQRSQCSQFNH